MISAPVMTFIRTRGTAILADSICATRMNNKQLLALLLLAERFLYSCMEIQLRAQPNVLPMPKIEADAARVQAQQKNLPPLVKKRRKKETKKERKGKNDTVCKRLHLFEQVFSC